MFQTHEVTVNYKGMETCMNKQFVVVYCDFMVLKSQIHCHTIKLDPNQSGFTNGLLLLHEIHNKIQRTGKVYLCRNMQTLMLPSILRLVSCRRSSSSGAKGPSRCSNASDALERFSNSVRHLFRSSKRKVQGLFGGSKFGASSESLLHNCAYIELYFGSSRALSKICKTKKTFISPQSKNRKHTPSILSHTQFS